MSKAIVTEQYLFDIGDAIRSKVGGSATYKPSQMASAISNIRTASDVVLTEKTITENGTYNPSSDNADGYSSVVVDISNIYTQEDEGKVVSSGGLVSQTSREYRVNGSYDTTLVNSIVVDVGSGDSDVNYMIAMGASTGVVADNKLSKIGAYAFYKNSYIYGFSSPIVELIDAYAFFGCGSLNSVHLPKCKTIGSNAFVSCGITSIDLPLCTSISEFAFFGCSKMINYSLPNCTYIGNSVFQNNSILESINLPSCSSLQHYAFKQCSSLKYVSLPMCEYIGYQAFCNCYDLSEITLPKVYTLGSYAFSSCINLESITIYGYIISNSAFYNCSKLKTVKITYGKGTSYTAAAISSNVFRNTPINNSTYLGYYGSIYVPSEHVDIYKSKAGWSYYSDRITAYVE